MVDRSAAVRRAVPLVPVIAAGRPATPGFAGRALAEQRADPAGLARVVLGTGWGGQNGANRWSRDDPARHVGTKRVSGLSGFQPGNPVRSVEVSVVRINLALLAGKHLCGHNGIGPIEVLFYHCFMAGGFEILRSRDFDGAFECLDSPFGGDNPGGIPVVTARRI